MATWSSATAPVAPQSVSSLPESGSLPISTPFRRGTPGRSPAVGRDWGSQCSLGPGGSVAGRALIRSPMQTTRVTDLIRLDHIWFRNNSRHSRTPGMMWRRSRRSGRALARLEVHAAAEEILFYPRLLKDDPDAADDTKDAIRDHNDIRDGIRRGGRSIPSATGGGGMVSMPPSVRTRSTWKKRSTAP